jgi:hypothetical protein
MGGVALALRPGRSWTVDNELKEGMPFRFSDHRQERICRRLLLIGPGPAAFYKDACTLMQGRPPLEATTHLVAHLLREIESAMRDVLEIVRAPQATPNNHQQEILAILLGLGFKETDPVARAWLELATRDSPYNLAARAHRDSLAAPRPLDGSFKESWDRFQAILDAMLDAFESHYLGAHSFIDRLLQTTAPSPADAWAVQDKVPHNRVSLGYFFEKAPAAWLVPLRDEGFFTSPPPPEYDREQGTIAFPMWPESRYLARIASILPAEVCEVILKIPDTQNVRVHEDVADAACAMPPGLASKLAEGEIRWLASQKVLWCLTSW